MLISSASYGGQMETSHSATECTGVQNDRPPPKGSYSAEVTSTMDNNFYVDDLLKSVDTEIHTLALHKG